MNTLDIETQIISRLVDDALACNFEITVKSANDTSFERARVYVSGTADHIGQTAANPPQIGRDFAT